MQNDSFHSVQHWPYKVSIPLFIYYLYLIPNTITFAFPDQFILIFSFCAFLLSIWEFSSPCKKAIFYSFYSQMHRKKKKNPARSDMPKMINILSVSFNLMSVVKELITKSEKQKRFHFAHDADCHFYQRCLSGRMLQ